MDGGTVWNTNLVSAVERCRETADDDSDITVDILVCRSYNLPPRGDTGKTLENYLRYEEIKSYHQDVNDVVEIMQAYPKVNFRYYVSPSETLAGGLDIINVNNATVTWPMQMIGRKDGETAVKAGDGFFFDKIRDWLRDPQIKEEFPTAGQYLTFAMETATEAFQEAEKETEIIQ